MKLRLSIYRDMPPAQIELDRFVPPDCTSHQPNSAVILNLNTQLHNPNKVHQHPENISPRRLSSNLYLFPIPPHKLPQVLKRVRWRASQVPATFLARVHQLQQLSRKPPELEAVLYETYTLGLSAGVTGIDNFV